MYQTFHCFGGGTFSHVRNHLSLAAPAFGGTARLIEKFLGDHHGFVAPQVMMHLTKMAGGKTMETNTDVARRLAAVEQEFAGPGQKTVIYLSTAMVDYGGQIDRPEPGKLGARLSSRDNPRVQMDMIAAPKVIESVRKERHQKKNFLVAFKTTCGEPPEMMYAKGLRLLKSVSANLVVANDVVTRKGMIVVPEESYYGLEMSRENMIAEMVAMSVSRSNLHYTRTNVIGDGNDLVPWSDPGVPSNLKTVVEWLINNQAYKPYGDNPFDVKRATAGHFAFKKNGMIVTTIRKSNFNFLPTGETKMVLMEPADVDGQLTCYGAKPSVGGISQRIVFDKFKDLNCIVHFHSPAKGLFAPTVAQKPYECGSHECGMNMAMGLRRVMDTPGGLGVWAVMLDNHGPNIVFGPDAEPDKIINYIGENFDVAGKTGGPVG
jgi:hypothetical protein